MVKNKLKKFAQINSFSNVIQPGIKHPAADSDFKGNWNRKFFCNDNPIVLEIGCGKGEYTVGLARLFPEKNFIGIDIKGDRIWVGARQALEYGLPNTVFLRIQAERIEYFFNENEISEIWITFPDPQLRGSRSKKRLTSPKFLNRYSKIVKPQSSIHLKTDNRYLFDYTLEVIEKEGHRLLFATEDLYLDNNTIDSFIANIQTYYEKKFLDSGLPIYYLKFQLLP